MTGESEPLDAQLMLDGSSQSPSVVREAHVARQLSGAQAFVFRMGLLAVDEPLTLLPPGFVVERAVAEEEGGVTLLASRRDTSVLVESGGTWTSFTISSTDPQTAAALGAEIRAKTPSPAVDEVDVRIWAQDHHGNASRVLRSMKAPAWTDIETNYSASVRMALDEIVRVERPVARGRLLLWHGAPGTGKTTALRALMRSWASWCKAEYIADPEQLFGCADYLTQVLAANEPGGTRTRDPWKLIIAEDSDEYLRTSARRSSGASLGRLLNVADGILGQGVNAIVLLTTNEEISRLHPALVRPGRCLAALEFTEFDVREATAWLGYPVPVPGPMTLADLLRERGDLTMIGNADAAPTTGQFL